MGLIEGDCLEVKLPKVKMIIADVPDNIGLDYAEYKDNLLPQHYNLWLEKVMRVSMNHAEIVWLSYNAKHDLAVSVILADLLRERAAWSWKKIIWTYTFGQYNDKDFGPSYRPIIRLMSWNARIYPDAVREESERMRLGDSRAAGPRVPGDVWEFPRVTGNSRERQAWHPTQHPVALYKRMVDFSCGPEDTFMDLFAGSGTCFRVGKPVIGVEIDSSYCEKLRGLYQSDDPEPWSNK